MTYPTTFTLEGPSSQTVHNVTDPYVIECEGVQEVTDAIETESGFPIELERQ